MMKRLMTLAANSLAIMLFFAASYGAIKPMCVTFLHEPDIPEALK